MPQDDDAVAAKPDISVIPVGTAVPESSTGLKIFISYSRKDALDFAQQLKAALETCGHEGFLDLHGIAAGEAWQDRLSGLILEADTVVFVVTPEWAASNVCAWEVEESQRRGKRMMPIAALPLGGAVLPPVLAARNYIHFYAEPGMPGAGFGTGLQKLVKALATDLDWIREHTRIAALAERWRSRQDQSADDTLLVGRSIELAEAWLADRPSSLPPPPPLVAEFVAASRAAADGRLELERRQLQERERLVREAEAALTEKEAAQRRETEASRKATAEAQRAAEASAREARAQRRAVKRTRIGLAASVFLTTVAGLAGLFAYQQKGEADAQRLEAVRQSEAAQKAAAEATTSQKEAVVRRNEALLTQSKFLADISRQVLEQEKDPTTAMLVALQGLSDAASDDAVARDRPYWPPLEVSLEAARRVVQEKATLLGHSALVSSVAVTPDGTRLLTAAADKTVKVWDARTFAELATLKGHTAPVRSVVVSQDGQRIVTAAEDRSIKVWSATTFAELATHRNIGEGVLSLVFTPGGERIVASLSHKRAVVWDARTFAVLGKLEGHTGPVMNAAVTPDGTRILTASGDRTARVWDATTFAQVGVLEGHTNVVSGVAVSPDGMRFYTSSGDGTAKVWDAVTFTATATLKGHGNGLGNIAVTPDGARLVTVSDDRTAKVWDAKTLVELSTLRGHGNAVLGLALTAEGGRLLTGSSDGTARVWDLQASPELARFEGYRNGPGSIAVTPDGSRILTAAFGPDIRIFDARTFAELAPLQGRGMFISVAVTSDGARIVTGSRDKTARVWDASSLKEIARLEGHADTVWSVAVTGDGARIVTASEDGTAKVWDARRFVELATMKGHVGAVRAVAVSPDGTRIVTAGQDKMIRIWDAKSFAELAVLRGHTHELISVAVSPDGTRIVSGADDYTARVWQLFPTGQALVAEAQRIAPRCLTAEQRRRFHLTTENPGWCRARDKWPDDAITVANAAEAVARRHLDDKRFREAVTALEATIARAPAAAGRLEPTLALAYTQLASALFLDVTLRATPAEGLQEALAYADKSVALRPDDLYAIATRGPILLALGRADEAIAAMDIVVAKATTPLATTWYTRGRAHEMKGNREAAIADYRKAVAGLGFSDWGAYAQKQAAERLEALAK